MHGRSSYRGSKNFTFSPGLWEMVRDRKRTCGSSNQMFSLLSRRKQYTRGRECVVRAAHYLSFCTFLWFCPRRFCGCRVCVRSLEIPAHTKAPHQPPSSFGSIISVSGPLLSYSTLSKLCPTPILIAHPPPSAETALPSTAIAAFKKGSQSVTVETPDNDSYAPQPPRLGIAFPYYL